MAGTRISWLVSQVSLLCIYLYSILDAMTSIHWPMEAFICNFNKHLLGTSHVLGGADCSLEVLGIELNRTHILEEPLATHFQLFPLPEGDLCLDLEKDWRIGEPEWHLPRALGTWMTRCWGDVENDSSLREHALLRLMQNYKELPVCIYKRKIHVSYGL